VCVGDDRGFLLLVDVGIGLFTSAKSYHLSLTGRQKSHRMMENDCYMYPYLRDFGNTKSHN